MMNGVGGSVIHWGGALRRCHPHHFQYLILCARALGRARCCPAGHTLADWPLSYDDLEAYYTTLEYHIGVAGDGDSNPFIPRSTPIPMPPLRPFTHGRTFRSGDHGAGLASLPHAGRGQQRPLQRLPGHDVLRLERRLRPLQRRALASRPDLGARGAGHRELRPAHPLPRRPRADRQRRPCPRRRVCRCQRQLAGAGGAHGHPVQLHVRERAPAAPVGRRAASRRAGQQHRAGRASTS